MRSVTLVEFPWGRDKDPRVPLGHASLKVALAAAGCAVRSVVRPVNAGPLDAAALAEALRSQTPADGVIAVGAYVWAEAVIQRLVPALRAQGYRGLIVLGGPQVSYAPGGLEQLYPGVDAFVRGYGEQALVQIAHSPRGAPIVGVHWAGQADLGRQAQVALEALPSPWLTGAIPLAGQAFIRWETQRGCPFRCTFCQHREAGARLAHRALADDRVAAEIDAFCEAGVRDVAVLDPIFNARGRGAAVLARFAERGFTGRLSLQCRAETLPAGFLEAAQALDVRLEFGLQTVHPAEGAAVRRRNHIERVDAALAEVRARGIAHEVSLIYGLPHQTLASFEASVAWCLARQVPVIKAFPLLLLRGTQLARERARWGYRTTGGAMAQVVASNTFSQAEGRQMAALSQALRATEGRHPPTLAALRRLAADLRDDPARWRPAA